METHENKQKRIANAKLLIENLPDKVKNRPIVRLGKESHFRTFVLEQQAKMKPKKEKKPAPVKKVRKVSELTQRIGELSDSGLDLKQIAAKVGLTPTRTKARLDVWLRVMD